MMVTAALCMPASPLLAIEQVELAPLGSRDVRVRLEASGVCRSDLLKRDEFNRSDPGAPAANPMILGHEGAGIVVATGADVVRCAVGDRVIASFVPACGHCWHCVRSESQHCETGRDTLVSRNAARRADGSDALTMAGLGTFAEEMVVGEDAVVPIRSDLPAEQLALIGCGASTGVGAVLWTAGVRAGETVAVFGCGGVGQFVVQGARIAGASQIVAVDPLPAKRDAALAFGATAAVDPTDGDVADAIRALTAGRGVDHAFDVVGYPQAFDAAYRCVRRHGKVIVMGKPPSGTSGALPLDTFFREEKQVIGSLYGSVQIRTGFTTLVTLAENGGLNLAAMISRRFVLGEINDALAALEHGEVLRGVIGF